MAIPLIPWEPSNFPDQIQNELNRRRLVRDINYVSNEKGGWDEATGDWSFYKGPMTPWVRFCSNGAGRRALSGVPRMDRLAEVAGKQSSLTEYFDKQGFVLFGGKDFYTSYGFLNPSVAGTGTTAESIIGYLPNGYPHTIENDVRTSNYPIHVPPPEIEKITVTIQRELFRRATVDWVCFSSEQLKYMTPYFLVPGITCILEWGWNLFDPTSLLDLRNTQELKNFNNNPYPLYTNHILKSNGNYDVLFGKVTHFEWSIDNLRIQCKTEITSQDRIYAGLVVNSVMSDKTDEDDVEQPTKVLDSLKKFVDESLPKITQIINSEGKINQISGSIGNVVNYIQKEYGENSERSNDILYGIFYGGRETNIPIVPLNPTPVAGFVERIITPLFISTPSIKDGPIDYTNTTYDFDYKDNSTAWINMGLLVEILNYHSAELVGFNNKQIFRIDIDKCVVGGHPNLISTDGNAVLIPNAMAPKYFFGGYGYAKIKTKQVKGKQIGTQMVGFGGKEKVYETISSEQEYKDKLSVSDDSISFEEFGELTREIAEANDQLADYRLMKICMSNTAKAGANAYRDDLNVVINQLRLSKGLKGPFEFPFKSHHDSGIYDAVRKYPAKFSGYLKNIYFSVKALQKILEDSSVKTFTHVLERVLEKISICSGNFFDLRLESGTGKSGDAKDTPAPMTIADNRFIYSINPGKVYSFDYYDADSLLQSIKFTPTLSNAQAIRTIYAETNNPSRNIVINDSNELLNYQFKDRLFLDETHSKVRKLTTTDGFKETMSSLQSLKPPDNTFQVTTKASDGKVIIKRLAMPSDELLTLLLDDGDGEHNPKYLGIMPGIQAQFTIQGIGGLRTFMMFLVRNLPEPYSHKNIVFRIIDLTENLEAGKWTTTITAGVLPLRSKIKERLGIVGE